MPIAHCAWLLPALFAAMAGTAAAQAPTPPNDTLHAGFAPHFRLGPAPQRAPAMPGDSLKRVPEPALPDGALFGEQEEVPIPERIAGLRLA